MNKLVWLRNDLRTDDHAAFNAAISAAQHDNSQVYALYIICDKQWDAHHVALSRRYLVLKTLQSLEISLRQYGISLLIIQGSDFDASIEQVKQTAQEYQCDSIYIHYEIALNERQRDKKAHGILADAHITLHALHGSCLLPPKSVLKDDGQPYRVYTPFKNKCLPYLEQVQPIAWNYQQAACSLLNKNQQKETQSQAQASQHVLKEALRRYESAQAIADLWLHDESKILKRLQDFCESEQEYSLVNYKAQRDIPSIDGTSRLSPYLSIGSLSAKRAFYQATQAYIANANISEGYKVWRNELLWRDFYRHILVMYPHLSKGYAFKEEYNNLQWHGGDMGDTEFVAAWKEGRTGYPIVDAAMRQLKSTGWMHNRLRMVTAMFFSKYALHDWHIGERYFMSQLIDGDFAANNGGWQWSSSTGTDAAPYFRLLSPLRQAERFDRQTVYIKNFVPELQDVAAQDIIKLKPSITVDTGYPEPILDTKGKKDIISQFFKANIS